MQKKEFGVGFIGENSINENIKYAKQADQMGFTNCWIAEDYFYGGVYTMATACVAATENINVSIGVLNPFTRHPAVIAMESAALYTYSGKRLTLGLGGSNKVWIEQQAGIPFTRVVSKLDEAITIIRKMVNGETVNHDGENFHLRDVFLRVPNAGSLPIFMGVKSEKLLRLAAKKADGVVLSIGASLPYIKWVKEQLEQGAKEVGRNLDDFSIAAYFVILIDEDRDKARALCRERVAYMIGLHGDHPIMRIAGLTPEQIEPFREGFLTGNHRADLVTEEMLDTFAIAGTPEECRQKLRLLYDAGLTQPVLFDYSLIPMEENMRRVKEYLFDV